MSFEVMGMTRNHPLLPGGCRQMVEHRRKSEANGKDNFLGGEEGG